MKEILKSIGTFAVAGVLLLALTCLSLLCIFGSIWVSGKLLPILSDVCGFTLLACLFVLVPMAMFHSTRGYAGVGLLIASHIFGLTLWMFGLLLSYSLWGFGAALVGLLMGGIGVVPIAMLAASFNGLWGVLVGLVFLLVLTCGSYMMALYLTEKYEQRVAVASA